MVESTHIELDYDGAHICRNEEDLVFIKRTKPFL